MSESNLNDYNNSILFKAKTLIKETLDTLKDERAKEQILYWQVCEKYSELGYGKPDAIIIGDFNLTGNYENRDDDPILILVNKLKDIGNIAFEWYEECSICEECSNIVITIADSDIWIPYYSIIDETLYCIDCIKKSYSLTKELINICKNDPEQFIYKSWKLHLAVHGFEEASDQLLKTGSQDDQYDCPKVVMNSIKQLGYNFDVIFVVDNHSQFATEWTVLFSNKDGTKLEQQQLKYLKDFIQNNKYTKGFSPNQN